MKKTVSMLKAFLPKNDDETVWLIDNSLKKFVFEADYVNEAFANHVLSRIEGSLSSSPKIISFIDGATVAFGRSNVEVINWSDYFSYDEYFDLWEEAYSRVSKFVELQPSDIQNKLLPFYHDLAVLWQKTLTFEAVLKQEVGNLTYFLLPNQMVTKVFAADNSFRALPYSHMLRWEHWSLIFGKFSKLNRYTLRRIFYPVLLPLEDVLFLFEESFRFIKFKLAPRALKRSISNNLKSIGIKTGILDALKIEGLNKSSRSVNGSVLMTLEDSGTFVNLGPGLRIIDALEKRGAQVVTITTSPIVVETLKSKGFKCIYVYRNFWDNKVGENDKVFLTQVREGSQESDNLHEKLFLNILEDRYLNFCAYSRSSSTFCDLVRKYVQPKVVLSVNEAFPLAVNAGLSFKKTAHWMGFWPILLGRRPDCYFFPAQTHLAYGDQLKDIMLEANVDPKAIKVVGTPTFDVGEDRSNKQDREYVEKIMGRPIHGKLILVATEAFNQPERELGPIFEALKGRPNDSLILKLHPSDSVTFFKRFVQKFKHLENRLIILEKCDLDALLNSADILICTISNIIIRAAQYGTPCLSCDFSQRTRVLSFVDENLAYGCLDPSPIAIQEKINEILRIQDEDPRAQMVKLKEGIRRFNGPNDGLSHERVAQHVIDLF